MLVDPINVYVQYIVLTHPINLFAYYNIQGDIRTLLEKDCEVEKMMRFLREIGMFEEI